MNLRSAMIVALIALAQPGLASDDPKVANCEATADIARMAMLERKKGQNQDEATAFLMSDAAQIDALYHQVVPAMVGWIYTLEAQHLNESAVTAFRAQCLDYAS